MKPLTSYLHTALAIALISAALTACGLFGPSERIAVMDIASQRVPCVGAAPQQCLLVREHPDTAWSLFYDGIAGFDFEPGFEYTVRVAIRHVDNPPADGPSLSYRLVAILRKAPPA